MFRNDSKMLSIRQLNRNIDSLKKVEDSFKVRLKKEVALSLHYLDIPDSTWNKARVTPGKFKSFDDLVPDSAKYTVFEQSISKANNLRSNFQFTGGDLDSKKLDTRFNKIEWHRKFSFSMACLVLFFIGAPLGSIIRKGGFGMPLVAAIIFFVIFHLLNIFGEKFAKENITSAFFGMWLAIFVLIPIGIFLTYKAMHDSQLFNKEFYNRMFKKIRPIFKPVVNALNKPK